MVSSIMLDVVFEATSIAVLIDVVLPTFIETSGDAYLVPHVLEKATLLRGVMDAKVPEVPYPVERSVLLDGIGIVIFSAVVPDESILGVTGSMVLSIGVITCYASHDIVIVASMEEIGERIGTTYILRSESFNNFPDCLLVSMPDKMVLGRAFAVLKRKRRIMISGTSLVVVQVILT